MTFHHLAACFQWGQNIHHKMDQADVYFITIMGDFYMLSIFTYCTKVLQQSCINQIPTWTLTQWADGRIYDSSWSPACSPRNHGQTNRTEEFLAWDHYWTKWLHCHRTQNLPGNCSRNMPPQKRRPPLLLRWKRG